MSIMIELSPEMEHWLEQEAARQGQDVRDYARALLEEIITAAVRRPDGRTAAWVPRLAARSDDLLPGGVRRRSPAELLALAEEQGVRPVERFEDLLGDWSDAKPGEEFDVDAFLEARHQWQQDDGPGFPFDEPDESSEPKRQA